MKNPHKKRATKIRNDKRLTEDKIKYASPVKQVDYSELPMLEKSIYPMLDPRMELEHSSSDLLCMVSESRIRDCVGLNINPVDKEYDLYKWIPAVDLSITLRAGTEGKRLFIM